MFQKKKKDSPEQLEAIAVKDFFDMILPGVVKFMSDHYICGGRLLLRVGHPGVPAQHRGPGHPLPTGRPVQYYIAGV